MIVCGLYDKRKNELIVTCINFNILRNEKQQILNYQISNFDNLNSPDKNFRKIFAALYMMIDYILYDYIKKLGGEEQILEKIQYCIGKENFAPQIEICCPFGASHTNSKTNLKTSLSNL